MDIDNFNEAVNMVYIAKKLYDLGRYELVEISFFDVLDYDSYYCGIYDLIGNLFEHSTSTFYEQRNFELYVLSAPVIVDFYTLAGEYGKLCGIPDNENTYIKNAKEEVAEQLTICYCMDWCLMAHTKPERPFHSRIGIFVDHDCGCCDMGVVAIRLIDIYEWFKDECAALTIKKA